MEANTIEETAVEVKIFEDSKTNQNHDVYNCEGSLYPQHENQNWETPCIKSELNHGTTSPILGDMLHNSHYNTIMKEENICVDNKDALYNVLCGVESPEYNMDINNTSDDLRQFDVLDDIDRHTEQNYSDADSGTDESMDSDVPDEEIEAMLEEGIL